MMKTFQVPSNGCHSYDGKPKAVYRTYKKALRAGQRTMATTNVISPLLVYHCQSCGFYHLTSQRRRDNG